MGVAISPDVTIYNGATSYTYGACGPVKSRSGAYYLCSRITPASGYDGHVHMKSTWIDIFKSVDKCKTWTKVSTVDPANAAYDTIPNGICIGVNNAGEEIIFVEIGHSTTGDANVRAPNGVVWSKDGGATWTSFYDMTVLNTSNVPGGVVINYDGASADCIMPILSNGDILFRMHNHLDTVTGSWVIYTLICNINEIEDDTKWIWYKGYTDGTNQVISEPATIELSTSGTVLTFFREETTIGCFKQISTDYGRTWTTPVDTSIYTTSPGPNGSPPSLIKLSNGYIVALLGRQTITAWLSKDQGATWTQLIDFIDYPVAKSCSYQGGVEISPHWLFVAWSNTARGDSEGWVSYEYGNFYYVDY